MKKKLAKNQKIVHNKNEEARTRARSKKLEHIIIPARERDFIEFQTCGFKQTGRTTKKNKLKKACFFLSVKL